MESGDGTGSPSGSTPRAIRTATVPVEQRVLIEHERGEPIGSADELSHGERGDVLKEAALSLEVMMRERCIPSSQTTRDSCRSG